MQDGRPSQSVNDGSVDHLIYPTPLSHEFRFGIRGLLVLMFLVGTFAGLLALLWPVPSQAR